MRLFQTALFSVCWNSLGPTARWRFKASFEGQKSNCRVTDELERSDHSASLPDASAEVIAQRLQQASHVISIRSVERVISDYGLQKGSACRPKTAPQFIQTQRNRRKERTEPCDPASLERKARPTST